MGNFKQMYTKVQRFIADDSSTTLTIIKDVLNEKAQELLQDSFWRFALRDTTITTVASTTDYYLPSDLDKILDIRQQDSPMQLKRVFIADFNRLIPEPTETGVPKYYSEILEDRVLGQPTTANKVVFYSTSDQDVAPEDGSTFATIWGVIDGVDRVESVALSATNVTSCVSDFTKIYSITTNIKATGTIRFTEETVGTTLLELYPNETFRTYKKIKMHPIPDGAYTIYVRYQANQPTLTNDADVLIFPDRYSDVIADMAIADMLERQGDHNKAQVYYAKSQAGKSRMKKEQDLLWDFVPGIRNPESGTSFVDYSYPFNQ